MAREETVEGIRLVRVENWRVAGRMIQLCECVEGYLLYAMGADSAVEEALGFERVPYFRSLEEARRALEHVLGGRPRLRLACPSYRVEGTEIFVSRLPSGGWVAGRLGEPHLSFDGQGLWATRRELCRSLGALDQRIVEGGSPTSS